MLRKNYLTSFLAIALFLTGGLAVFAQTAPVRGKVELKKADGTFEPVAGAVIDVYRTDVKGKQPSNKTNKKGEFAFAGLPVGTFAFVISAPNIKPEVFPNVRAGNDAVNITVVAGDGKRLTEDEARASLAAIIPTTTPGAKPAELTAEQKKAQAEYEKQVAEINAKNTKTQNNDALIKKVLAEGNKSYEDKNFDVAIAKYDEGINAEPDFAGSAPVLLNNKTASLLARARINYNQAVKLTDAAAKTTALIGVKKDLEDAVASSDRALTVLKSATASDASIQKGYDSNKFQALGNRKDAYWLMSKTGADRTKGKETLAAYEEYMAVETDAKKKTDAQLALAEALQESNEFDLAVVEFEKVLAQNPDNVDALVGAGLSLVNVGFISNDKAKLQQGANYLQKFVDTAPDTHKYKADAKGVIDNLKNDQKVTPQKVTKGTTKKKS